MKDTVNFMSSKPLNFLLRCGNGLSTYRI